MSGSIYRKPVLFTIVATVAVLVGTIVMMAYPMFRQDMHPRLEKLQPYTPLQLAGRDVYQREGCVNCHTQTVRPLAAEVARYGDYSKAGEFAYDNPFLWGSKRTGPDLARIGGKYPDAWHLKHFANPQHFAAKSNMPKYAFLAEEPLDAGTVRKHYLAFASLHGDVDVAAADFAAAEGKTAMDALVSYMQVLGTAVARPKPAGGALEVEAANPLAGSAAALAAGKKLYADNCAMCHGDVLEGTIAPALKDQEFLYQAGDPGDAAYFKIIHGGTQAGTFEGRKTEGGMPPFGSDLSKDEIWSLVELIRASQGR